MLRFPIPEPEVKARASSHYTLKNVNDRLKHLRTLDLSEETDREIRYLQKLKLKKGRL